MPVDRGAADVELGGLAATAVEHHSGRVDGALGEVIRFFKCAGTVDGQLDGQAARFGESFMEF
ncbi:hypothetical protein OS242_19875 [Tumebacillus sp. DT12]|uniref:Uncharacterized protein n=1 Tax=Tumebacillus lacus TaxID=2995335 RepID=A0ABT3XBP1_9BACL|nr:hypothetical protein [Tumebacillus lacus]MCX7572179.1 hypothetical protein [Tumebacillus lacus]